MTQNYKKQDLIREILQKHNCTSYQFLDERPEGHCVTCVKCRNRSVRVRFERYGDGTKDYVKWAVDTWVGVCQTPMCWCLNLWMELIEQDKLDQENRRRIIAICDRELKSL